MPSALKGPKIICIIIIFLIIRQNRLNCNNNYCQVLNLERERALKLAQRGSDTEDQS